jgi:hypothetical protein
VDCLRPSYYSYFSAFRRNARFELIIVAISTWIVFCIRDYCLIHAGSSTGLRRRATSYALATLVTTVVVWLALMMAGPYRVWVAVHSSWLLGVAIAIHVLMTTWAVWMERSDACESGWRICLLPAPAPWILLILICGRLMSHSGAGLAPMAILLIPIAWAAFICLTIRSERYGLPSSDFPGFSVVYAGWANSMVFCLVPLIVQ